MSRVHITSRPGNTPSERVDSRKHENRPSLGCEGLHSSRTLLYWYHDWILISRQNNFSGSRRERNQKIRHTNVRRHSCWKHWTCPYREICSEGEATTKACCDIVSCFYSYSWKKMDRHQSSIIQWGLFCSVEIHDQITATRWLHSQRRWWSSKIWRPDWKVQSKVRWFFGVDSWCLDNFPGKKRRREEKVSILLES